MSRSNELRVFISSTFRDMQEEREHLVKKIFPEIRALCRQRGITFTEVDLRWGLTDEDVVLGQVVRTCLEEIDRCRPYFIGLVGERYGWAPPLHEYYKDPELFSRWPWLEDAAMAESSITDIEFRHGALNDPASADHARFFFRRKRRSLGESSESADDDDGAEKLEDLKSRVRDAGLTVETFRDPVSLGELIYDELIEIIERDFADAKPPTPLEQERSRHTAFAASRRRAYIPNPDYLRKLNDWLADDETTPLILYAESGSGKSSLVSFWCEQLRRRQPDLHIIEHYVGIGAGDADHLGIIKHVMEEIRERYDRSEEIPSKPAELEQAFSNWLGFNVGAPMLLVIDGINQLSGHALDLHWLPPVMPEGVKLIISSTVEGTLVDLRRRGWSELGMQPLSESEREAVVVRFLAEYSKALSSAQVRRIATDVKSSHPLFLRTLLEELRLHGLHEHLDRTLDHLLNATGTEDLFQKVLERLEDDYSQKAVREVLSLIWASRSGLSEEDLESLTGISRLKLSTMLLGLDYHLVRRDGMLTFFHDYLRRAVEKRYLSEEPKQQESHERLAGYFARADVTLRGTLELLHALEAMADRESLQRELSTIERFTLLWKSEELEVLRLWSSADISDVVAAYRRGLDRWSRQERGVEERGEVSGDIALLYDRIGAWSAAEEVQRDRLETVRKSGDRRAETAILAKLAELMFKLGRVTEAEHLARSSEAIARELGDRRNLAHAVSNRGEVHARRAEYPEALACFRESEEIGRELGDRRITAYAVGNRGNIHVDRGEYPEALACYREQEKVGREMGDRRSVAWAVGNRGNVHGMCEEYPEALACHREQEEIARGLGDRRTAALAAGNRGSTHGILGEHAEAFACFEASEEIARKLGDRHTAALVTANRGTVHMYRGEYPEALACFRRAAEEHRDLGNLPMLCYWLASIAEALLVVLEHASEEASPEQMPAYLAEYLSNPDPQRWQAETLQTARASVEECVRINRESRLPDVLFNGRLLLARIEAAEGNTDRAIEELETMLAEAEESNQTGEQAELHYRLWKLGAPNHHTSALALYEELYGAVPMHEHHKRLEELKASPTAPNRSA